jgi:hypothetical protein
MIDEQKWAIEEAKIRSAVDAARGMLAAALEAAHVLVKEEHAPGEDEGCSRMLQLGHVVEIASALGPAQLSVLFAVAVVLHEIERGEGDRPTAEKSAALQ